MEQTENHVAGHSLDSVIFDIAGLSVTTGVAALAALFALALAVIVTTITYFRRDRERVTEMAETTSAALNANFREQLAFHERHIAELKAQVADGAAVNLDLSETNAQLLARLAASEAQGAEQARQEAENFQRLLAVRQQMTDEFKALAGDILKSNSEVFSRQNREQVDLLLKPLADKITEFHTGLMRDRAELGARIQHLVTTGATMSQEAHSLTRALKGNAQTQGAWGEMILATILKNAGLREGEQYRLQQSHTAEEGARLRTDVEVLLPNGDVLVVDSKVSLLAFEAFVNAEDDELKAQQLKAHIGSLRTHIRTLAGKEYHRHAGSGLDFVFLFVPIEAAFAVAVTAEPDIIEVAIRQGVLLTTPTTLLSALRTVANVWDIEKRQRNAEQIAERAGALYDKVAGFLDSMDKVDQALARTRNSFDDARNQLSEGRGSVVRQIERLRELGAKTNKRIGGNWRDLTAADAPVEAQATIDFAPLDGARS